MPTLDQRRRDILVIDSCLSERDVEVLSTAAESSSFEPQGAGRLYVRRERSEIEDAGIAELLWKRIGPHLAPIDDWFDGPGTPDLQPPVRQWRAVGCNPRSRFYRYGIGAAFSEHEDEPWRPDPQTRSMLTVLVYLPSSGCQGGDTVIDGEVVPVIDGRVVVFDHGLLHEGKPVEQGQKLVLRNDIVARATEPAY